MSDPSTLESTVRNLRGKTSTTAEKALVVIDAGIATEDNLAKIRSQGFDYLCVNRTRLKDYQVAAAHTCLAVKDNRGQEIRLQKVSTAGPDNDYYLMVESQAKKKKESSMNEHFRDGYLKGLEAIAGSLSKKGGIKQEDKVYERIGRLKQKYPSIHRYYQVDCRVEEMPAARSGKTAKRIVTSMTRTLKQDTDMDAQSGVYFLRTSLNDDNRVLRDSYNTIREIEYTFRVLKTDLDMRPIFHKKDDATMAHLHLAILAYWVVNTIRYQLKNQGINHQWNELVRIMNTQKAVTTTACNNCEQVIQVRRCSEPNEKVKQIYNAIKYKTAPFKKKKSVVHKSDFKKNKKPCFQPFRSD